MISISRFLEKFLKLDKDNHLKTILILETFKKVAGLELTKENIEIKGDRIKLKVNPVFRNEIFMRKSQIEDALRDQKIFLMIV